MSRNTSLKFNVRRGTAQGDKLILRHASHTRAIAAKLMSETGLEQLPGQITLGYFFESPGEAGIWAFAPAPTPLALACLRIDVVQRRICDDLALREHERQADRDSFPARDSD